MFIRFRAVAAAMLTLAGGDVAAGAGPEPIFRLTVCMSASDPQLVRAQWMAARMFQTIGVGITWRAAGRSCPPDGVSVALATETPAAIHPSVLAESLLFDGTRIRIFYDRVLRLVPSNHVPCLMAHVLAHEVAHLAQAIDRHSSEGLMKAAWDLADLQLMVRRPLSFTSHDIDLIHRGLETRAERLRVRAYALGLPGK